MPKVYEDFEQILHSLPVGASDRDWVEAAMKWLGPDDLPPAPMIDELLAILVARVPSQDRRKRVLDIAIAYGCGNWRTTSGGGVAWQKEWSEAICLLSAILERFVRQVYKALESRVVGFPRTPDSRSDADLLAMILIHPAKTLLKSPEIRCDVEGRIEIHAEHYSASLPPGSRMVFAFQDSSGSFGEISLGQNDRLVITAQEEGGKITHLPDARAGTSRRVELTPGRTTRLSGSWLVWQCTCGTPECAKRHRLESWDPSRVTLQSFLASVVKGGAKTILTHAFGEGMHLALLASMGFVNGGRLRIVPTEWTICCQGEMRYEGGTCPRCHQGFLPHKNKRVTRDLLVMVGIVPPAYEPQKRLHCPDKKCGNFYVLGLGCPLCKSALPQRDTVVWVRTFKGSVPFLDDQDLEIPTGEIE